MAPPSWAVAWRYLGAQSAGVSVAFWVKTLLVRTGDVPSMRMPPPGARVRPFWIWRPSRRGVAGVVGVAVEVAVVVVAVVVEAAVVVVAVVVVAAAEVAAAEVLVMRTRPSLRASRMVGWAWRSRVQVVGSKPP